MAEARGLGGGSSGEHGWGTYGEGGAETWWVGLLPAGSWVGCTAWNGPPSPGGGSEESSAGLWGSPNGSVT